MLKAAYPLAGLLCLAISCSEVRKVHEFKPLPSAIPRLTITGDSTATQPKISSLNINVEIAANMGTTTFDIHFYNPNDRVLEGEFEFPLADGQHITRYALDIDGKLREGVVVEKTKGRVAFENTIRAKIDPGLVEKTKGNNFRTRIYPLPARGYRHIVIAIEQVLEQEAKDVLYQLPLYAKDLIDTFSFKATVLKSSSKPQLDEKGIPGISFRKEDRKYVAEHNAFNYKADHSIAFAIPGGGNEDVILTENFNNETYFYVNSRIEAQYQARKAPSTVAVLWDISASGEKRDIEKELALLGQYLAENGNATVTLIPFNIALGEKKEFANGNAGKEELFKQIRSLRYDGGTQLGIIDCSKYQYDEILLFTDGISTFGTEHLVTGKSPISCITTSKSANYSNLKHIASQTHGSFIDLNKLAIAEALKGLSGYSLQVISLDYDNAAIADLIMPSTPVSNSGFSFAGKLKESSVDVRVKLGFGDEVVFTKNYTISKNEESEYDAVKRIWATMKIDELDREYEKNKKEITSLGKRYSIVTQNTSLIVLDRVEDYVEHEITPPAELLKEYEALVKEKKSDDGDKEKIAMDEALEAMDRLKEWWTRDAQKKVQQTEVSVVADSMSYSVRNMAIDMADSSVAVHTEAVPFLRVGVGNGLVNMSANVQALEEVSMATLSEMQNEVNTAIQTPVTEKTQISISEWKSGAGYLKILEQTAAKDRTEKYYQLKQQYGNQPSFFSDVAQFFFANKQKAMAILTLSNIAEMKLEDAGLLRIVANQLLEAGERELAIETFKQLTIIRGEEPQSYRDLALAYIETGEYNKAIELLYKLVLGSWDGRFGDVKAIALNEMNAIISSQNGKINTSGIDTRFIFAMPVDVRIVVGWNTDNSDIDLWVTDPKKEKCFYNHPETGLGGKISRDVTQGYGPEEYCLKKAINGDYVVEVNLYGDQRQTAIEPITIKAELFTDFGKSSQKRKMINLRVTENKEVVKIGSLRFGN